jgi:hypothetical protein
MMLASFAAPPTRQHDRARCFEAYTNTSLPSPTHPQLAAHLSEHNPGFRAAARRFARMTSDHADKLHVQLDALRTAQSPAGTTGGGAEEAALIAKQLRARAMAIRCHALGELSDADAAEAVSLLVSKA